MNQALTLSCPLTFEAAPASDAGTRPFSGLAYAGGIMHGAIGPAVVDLASITWPAPLPLLYQHEQASPVGIIDRVMRGADLRISGRLFAADGIGKDVYAKAQAGFPWGLSICLTAAAAREIPAGMRETINGRSLEGPFTLLTNGRMREVSVCSVAADDQTALQFSARDAAQRTVNEVFIDLTKPVNAMPHQRPLTLPKGALFRLPNGRLIIV